LLALCGGVEGKGRGYRGGWGEGGREQVAGGVSKAAGAAFASCFGALLDDDGRCDLITVGRWQHAVNAR
jgi:hypothetical protein